MLDCLDDAERDEVVAAATPLQLKTGDILAQQGAPASHFYVIEAGRLRLSQTTETGQEAAARTVGAGQSFGGTLLMGRPRYLLSARAQQPTRVLAWTRPMLMALIDKYPQLKSRIMETEQQPVVSPRDRFEDPGDGTAANRLAYVLTRLAVNGSRIDAQTVDIVHPLSRQELAELASADAAEANTLLKSWEDDGVVKLSRTHVRVLDLARMEHLARE